MDPVMTHPAIQWNGSSTSFGQWSKAMNGGMVE